MEGNIIPECAHMNYGQKYTYSQFLLQVLQLWWQDGTEHEKTEKEDTEWKEKTEVQIDTNK